MNLHQQMLDAWNACFARREKFIVLRIYQDTASLRQEKGIAQATKQWLASGAKDEITKFVRAMVIVVPPTQYQSMKSMSVEKVFAVPGSIHPAVGDATDWLKSNGISSSEQIAEVQRALREY